ncbi:MAG TPA: molecular chaperone HscC [Rhodanobacteraceae bacterium]|nr:molecular chaperone HscC [Rhodanobacteraceae bacterium]
MIAGIDLGTTHSLIGCYTDNGPRLFPNALGNFLTPSAVSIDDGGHVVVGQAARDRLISHPRLSVATFKRWMGSDRETILGTHRFRPEELSALVLRSLIADAEVALGEKVTEAVISVPAYFSDAQRKATHAAGELAGIKVERLINEPTAAALAYGLDQEPNGTRFLVLDLGGGTFDVSILEMFEGIVEVHASAGDNFLGGENFLDILEMAFLEDNHLDKPGLDVHVRAQLRRRLEVAKRELGTRQETHVKQDVQSRHIDWRIDEPRFASLAEPLVQRMRVPLERAMRDAHLETLDLDAVVLVGGASRMPLVSRLVSRMFLKLPLRHVDPDQGVAIGACIAAGLKARNQQLQETILTDVCPYTLGVSVSRMSGDNQRLDGFFEPIIHRNSTVPVSREDTLHPVHDGQKVVSIEVYQGESPMVGNNIKLGEIDIPLNPKLPRDENAVTVRFTYDIDGLLQVEAQAQATGQHHELILEQNPGILTPAQIRERLARLADIKVHPRDKQENIALLARAERLYEERLDQRDTLQEWIARFRGALDQQDENMIRTHRSELSKALSSLEND